MRVDKDALKRKLLSLTEEELRLNVAEYRRHLAESKVDTTETVDLDDQGRASAEALFAQGAEGQTRSAEQKLRVIDEIDFAPKTKVSPGAVVRFGGKNYVIAVATSGFALNGENYIGISTLSPAYKALEGLKVGESAKINGRSVKVEAVG